MHKFLPLLALGALLLPSSAQATWTALAHQPSFSASTTFLLLDGRVLCNEVDTSGFSTVRWWVLTPDANGSYQNGTWSRVGDARWTHLYFASAVFADGRVIIAGGEYSTGGSETNKTEIFNPLNNTWTEYAPPSGWANIGDAPCAMLQNNKMIMGDIFSNRTAIFDPVTNTWTAGPNTLNSRTTEETWTLLPDNTVLKWDCFGHPASERYLPTTNTWINCGNTPVDLVLPGSFETGSAILLPSGKTFCIGGTPRTCVYSMPSVPNQPGTWTAGPNPPLVNGQTVGAEDAPAAMTPDGKVLLCLGPVTAQGGTFSSPTYYFEYDGTNLNRITDPPISSGPPYVSHFLNLPTGEVLVTAGTAAGYLYTNGGQPNPAWKPVITGVPGVLDKGGNYVLNGTQLNGVSNGNSYGDEAFTATNYPVLRLKSANSGATVYCRTYDHSTMGVQTGNAAVLTHFAVPTNVASGHYQALVAASGITSDPVDVAVAKSANVSSFSIFRGTLGSGGLAELNVADDQYLVVNRGLVLNVGEAPIQLVFNGQAPVANPTYLGLQLETGTNTVGLQRTVELFNWQTNSYEQVDSRSGTVGDSYSIVDASGNLARFIDGSGNVRAKVSFGQAAPVSTAFFQARFDLVTFLAGN